MQGGGGQPTKWNRAALSSLPCAGTYGPSEPGQDLNCFLICKMEIAPAPWGSCLRNK